MQENADKAISSDPFVSERDTGPFLSCFYQIRDPRYEIPRKKQTPGADTAAIEITDAIAFMVNSPVVGYAFLTLTALFIQYPSLPQSGSASQLTILARPRVALTSGQYK
ncbi:MAG: hypothetical protein V7677_10485, partial [Motiliproteus sp.]